MSEEELHEVQGGRILCIHQGALGDFILAVPAIRALREHLQPTWLEIMGHPWILPLVSGPPYADAVTDINRAQMALLFQKGAAFPEALQAYLGAFDAAFYFGRSASFARNLRYGGIRKTFILPPFPARQQHLIDHHLCSLAKLGISAPSSTPELFLQDEAREEAEEFLRARGRESDEIIALHPGAGGRTKVWPPQRFAALGRVLARESKRLLIIQGPADEEVVQEVVTGLKGTPYLVVHDVPITHVAALLSHVSLFVGNDSGCSHLAAALGVVTLALFGPTDPAVWAPRGNRAFYLKKGGSIDTIEVADVLSFLQERKQFPLTPAAAAGGKPIDMPTPTCSHKETINTMKEGVRWKRSGSERCLTTLPRSASSPSG
jgi:ADP-heptose:LPS heptosyltransferase